MVRRTTPKKWSKFFLKLLLAKIIIFVIFPFLPSLYREQSYWTLTSCPWTTHFLGRFVPSHCQPSSHPSPSTLLFYPSSGPHFILLAESHLQFFQVTSDGSMNFISPAQRQRATRAEPTAKCSATQQVRGWGRQHGEDDVLLSQSSDPFSVHVLHKSKLTTTRLQHWKDLPCDIFSLRKIREVLTLCQIEKLAKARNVIWECHTIEIK